MALERFIPKSPDINIRNGQDFEVAKFGHLNTIVEYINNNTVQPAGLNGYVQFNDNNALGGDAGLFWDNVNKRLGVGTVTPLVPLNIYNNNAGISSVILVEQDTAAIIGQINQYRKNGSVNLVSGAEIGRLSFGGYFNSTYSPFSQVCSAVLGYYGGTGTDRVGGLRLVTWNGGGQTTRLQVSPDGKIGIGTTAPSAKLSILGEGSTSATTALLVQNSAGSTALQITDDLTVTVNTLVSFSNVSAVHGFYSGGLFTGTTAYTSRGFTSTVNTPFVTYNISSPLANPNNSSQKFGGYGFVFDGSTQWFQGVGLSLFTTPGPDVTVNAPVERLRITSTGNVGIGTTTPTNKLSIKQLDSNTSILRLESASSVGSNTYEVGVDFYSRITLAGGTDSYPVGKIYGIGGAEFRQGSLRFQTIITNGGSLTDTMTLYQGNVGIGLSTTPSKLLQVTGLKDTVVADFSSNTVANNEGISIQLSAQSGNYPLGVIRGIYSASGGFSAMTFSTTNSATITEAIRITSSQNVGIGLTAPTARLQVQGSGSTSATTSLLVTNSGGAVQGLAVSDDGTAYIGWDSTGAFNSYFSSNGDVQLGRYGNGLQYTKSINRVRLCNNNFEFLGSTLYVGHAALSGSFLFLGGVYNASAIVTLTSTTQGFLPPRMTNAQRGLITTPAIGLMVYCTDAVEGIYVYKSTGWTFVA